MEKVIVMNKVRVQHKDGDDTGINLIYIFYLQLKKHKELWETNKEDYVLNRFYKGLLTRILKVTELLIEKFKSHIDYSIEKKVVPVLEKEFSAFHYKETGTDLELIKTMFFAMILFNTAIRHKKSMIGVILKSMITDITKEFNEYVKMWIRDVDDNILKIEE